jgi:hypothetical protein
MFAVKTKKGPKDAQDTTSYMSLKEGETSGAVQLVKINTEGQEVEIMNTGVRVVLNMKENGFERSSPAPSAARGGLPGLITPRTLPGMVPPPMPAGLSSPPATQTVADMSSPSNPSRNSTSGRDLVVGGGPMRPSGSTPPVVNTASTTVGGNPGGSTLVAGGKPNTPVAIPMPPGLGAIPIPAPGSMQPPNSTPPNTTAPRTPVMPPMPTMPGQP